MCKFTTCDFGCQTVNIANEVRVTDWKSRVTLLVSSQTAGVVVGANSTIVVGVDSSSKDKCECPVWRAPSSCQANVCHNGAVCHNMQPGFLLVFTLFFLYSPIMAMNVSEVLFAAANVGTISSREPVVEGTFVRSREADSLGTSLSLRARSFSSLSSSLSSE